MAERSQAICAYQLRPGDRITWPIPLAGIVIKHPPFENTKTGQVTFTRMVQGMTQCGRLTAMMVTRKVGTL